MRQRPLRPSSKQMQIAPNGRIARCPPSHHIVVGLATQVHPVLGYDDELCSTRVCGTKPWSIGLTTAFALQANLRAGDSDVEMKRMRDSEDDSEVRPARCLQLVS